MYRTVWVRHCKYSKINVIKYTRPRVHVCPINHAVPAKYLVLQLRLKYDSFRLNRAHSAGNYINTFTLYMSEYKMKCNLPDMMSKLQLCAVPSERISSILTSQVSWIEVFADVKHNAPSHSTCADVYIWLLSKPRVGLKNMTWSSDVIHWLEITPRLQTSLFIIAIFGIAQKFPAKLNCAKHIRTVHVPVFQFSVTVCIIKSHHI